MARDSGFCRTVTLDAAPERLREVRDFVEAVAKEARLDPERAFDLKVAVSEASANAVEHSQGAGGSLEICATIFADRVVIEISDGGDFRLSSRGRDRTIERGLGLPLMVALMDEVRFFKNPDQGTTVALTLFRESPPRNESL